MTLVASQGPQAYVHTNGREWEIQEQVAAYYRRRMCTLEVATEYRVGRWGPPGPWAKSIGATGNMRPDVVVWCDHPSYNTGFMTVVEVKAGTASRRDVQQLDWYLRYFREQPSRGFQLRGILAAPALANSVHSLPPAISFWRIRPEWRT
jgi:hypothetical protein